MAKKKKSNEIVVKDGALPDIVLPPGDIVPVEARDVVPFEEQPKDIEIYDSSPKDLAVIDQAPPADLVPYDPSEVSALDRIDERPVAEELEPEPPPKELAMGDKVKWNTPLGKHASGKILGIDQDHAIIAVDAHDGEEHPVIYRALAKLRRG